jgi:ATP-binding cassette subfamily F protein 3
MILLGVHNLRKHFGPEPVLDGVTFDIRPGERVGLVGPNGAGKTTLMKIITGDQDADAGTVSLHHAARLGYLEQHPEFPDARTVWQEAQAGLAPLLALAAESERVAHALAAAQNETEHARLGQRFDYLQYQLSHHNAYNVEHRVEAVLTGLGFAESAYHQPIRELSGGQKNRLILAKLLLEEPDVMLLDEPSNHLDIEATEWLESFLIESDQALLIVSHDRYFLDRVTNRTLELYHGTVDDFPGNFTQYRRLKAERLDVQRRTYEKQQAEIAKMEDFVRRNFAAQKSAQAEDRRKKLERIERVALPREIHSPPMRFPAASRTGDIVVRAEGVSKAFDRPLFADLSFDILRGEKWGILGPNGCGKTTLLRCMLGQIPLDAGQVSFGSGVKVGYFDQMLSHLDPECEVADAVRPDHKQLNDQQRRDLLARFGVVGDMVFQKVSSLSGGERNRTSLALLAALDANLLILDEPTNHLDLWARDALEQALLDFDGTVIFVSHDRYFLNQVADHLLIVEPGRFRVIEGNYETYQHLVKTGLAAEARSAPATKSKNEPTASKNSSSDAPSAKRKRKFPYRKVAEIEGDIATREARIAQLTAALSSAEVLRDGDRVKATMAELEEHQLALSKLYEHWEEAHELNG